MEAVATTGAHGLSIDNKSLQGMLKDEVKIAFDNATGNEIFARKYKVKKSAEGRVGCIVKDCPKDRQDIKNLQLHCMRVHEISFSFRGEFILHIELKQRKIDGPHMSSEDARSIKYLPKSVSISNDCIKTAGTIGESSSSIADNNLQDILKDEVINAFENYIDDNHYGGKYKISIVDNQYECIIKGCGHSYQYAQNLRHHCLFDHNIRLMTIDRYIVAIEKLKLSEPSVCRECNKQSIHRGALKRHYSRAHGIECKLLKNGALLFTTEIGNKLSKTNEPDTDKVQDNTSATKTTTDNMDPTRKRSYFPATHEEESNAKKAMFNPSESGYHQSSSASENIDDKELYELVQQLAEVDNNFKTDVIKFTDICSTDLINTDFQFSATSQDIDDTEILELARELAENNSDFQDALNKDVADKYATSRDSYLQFSVTPIVISDDNVTSFSWCDDYSSR